jgi:hypothetical protein
LPPICLPFTILLNANGKVLSAKIYLLTLSTAYIFLLSLLQGYQINAHFFFLSEALVVYFIFPSKQSWNNTKCIIYIFKFKHQPQLNHKMVVLLVLVFLLELMLASPCPRIHKLLLESILLTVSISFTVTPYEGMNSKPLRALIVVDKLIKYR